MKCLALFIMTSFIDIMTCEKGIVGTVTGGGMPHIGDIDACIDDSDSMDGGLAEARFNYPWGITMDQRQNVLYVADCGCPDTSKSNDRIRKVSLDSHQVTTIAGSNQGYKDGTGTKSKFMHSAGMTFDSRNNRIFVADSGNDVIRTIDLSTNQVATFAGKAKVQDHVDGSLKKARFNNPQQVEVNYDPYVIMVADTDNHAVRKIDVIKKTIKTITGGPAQVGLRDGTLATALWRHPTGLTYDDVNDVTYVSDHYNHAVRIVDVTKNRVTTIAGGTTPGVPDSLHYPEGIALDADNGVLYVAEFGNSLVRVISLDEDNRVSVLAGGETLGSRDSVGRSAEFYHPTGLAFDRLNRILYVTDQYNHKIRSVTTFGNPAVPTSGNIVHHFRNIDGYRDLVVHRGNRVLFLPFFFLGSALLIFFFRKRIFALWAERRNVKVF